MKRSNYIAVMLFVALVFSGSTQTKAQNTYLNQFWESVRIRYVNNQLNGGVRAWMFQVAKESVKNIDEAIVKLENVDRDISFQNKLFFTLYTTNNGNRSNISVILNSMCGSYSLAVPVSNYIISSYSKDQKANAIIAKNKAIVQKEKEQRISKEAIEAAALRRKEDSLEKERWKDYISVGKSNGDTIPPKFKNGQAGIDAFLRDNLEYPESRRQSGIEGHIIVHYTIDVKGEVQNVEAEGDIALRSEAIRVIKLMPRWRAAKVNGKAVSYNMTCPINFSLNE